MRSQDKRILILLLILICVSLLLRIGTAVFLGDSIEEIRGGTFDQYFYNSLAIRVIEGHGFTFDQFAWPFTKAGEPTAHWSYLYTLFLAGIYRLFGHHPLAARLFQAIVVGIVTPLLTYRIAKRSFNNKSALIATAISSFYLYFVVYSASLMTEALYIVGILWIFDVAMRVVSQPSSQFPVAIPKNRNHLYRGIELGIAISITLLLRQVIVIFIFPLFVWLLWVAKRRQMLRTVLNSVLFASVITIVLVSPAIIRNYQAFGRLTMPNTNSGFALFWSNHPIYGTRFEPVLSADHGVTYQELIPEDLTHLDEAALDRALLREGLKQIILDPGRYILLSLSRIPVYFLFWPTTDSSLLSNVSRVLSFALLFPFVIFGFVITCRNLLNMATENITFRLDNKTASVSWDMRTYNKLLLILFVCIYTLIHLATWASVRYRLPVDAILIIFAAYGLNTLLQKIPVVQRIVSTAPKSEFELDE